MSNDSGTSSDEAQIRRLIEDRVRSVRARDVGAVLSTYAPDVMTFDVIDPLRHTGRESVGERLEAWLSSFQGPVGLEMRDLEITAEGGVAFGHALSHVSAARADGETIDMWWRSTLCLRKVDGRWMVTHEHSSVPFNPDTGKASLDLKP